jgi:hypothetical protein
MRSRRVSRAFYFHPVLIDHRMLAGSHGTFLGPRYLRRAITQGLIACVTHTAPPRAAFRPEAPCLGLRVSAYIVANLKCFQWPQARPTGETIG